MALASAGTKSFESSPAAALVVRFLLWPGMIGTALLCIAMWYFWFNFDDSSWFRKALWFIFLYFTVPVGPAVLLLSRVSAQFRGQNRLVIAGITSPLQSSSES